MGFFSTVEKHPNRENFTSVSDMNLFCFNLVLTLVTVHQITASQSFISFPVALQNFVPPPPPPPDFSLPIKSLTCHIFVVVVESE